MDKETLSHYGWIVVLVLILAVLLAFASPFGTFIADGFKATYAGFGMVGDSAINIAGIVTGNTDGTNNTPIPDNVNYKFDDDGGVRGVTPITEPETPAELPADKLPDLIEFGIGKFEPNATYTPGTYETVTYEESHNRLKMPVSYWNRLWSKWHVTKDVNGNITSVVPNSIQLNDIDEKYSTYIVYDFETDEALQLEGINGDSVRLWTIYNEQDDSLDNAIYLAAYLNMWDGKTTRHIAKWDGSKYVAVNYDAEIGAIDNFTETYTVTVTKTVEVVSPLMSTTFTYIPTGTLKAEKDMTWKEWLASDYNTTGETNPVIKTSNFEDVSYDDVIINGKNYGFYVSEYTLSGVWKLNETVNAYYKDLDLPFDYPWFEYAHEIYVSFTSNGEKHEIFVILQGISKDEESYILYAPSDIEIGRGYNYAVSVNEECRLMDFGSKQQAVSEEFYAWFIANATKQ